MAVDKLVDSAQLNSDLTSVANAIRTKGGTSASLAFPAGFVDAINAIPTGGGGIPVPSGCTLLDHADATGSCAIDTGVKLTYPSSGYLLYIRFKVLNSTATQIVFSSGHGGGGVDQLVLLNGRIRFDRTGTYTERFGINVDDLIEYCDSYTDTTNGSGVCYAVNRNTLASAAGGVAQSQRDIASPKNMILFAEPSRSTYRTYASVRFYEMMYYQADTGEIIHFYPIKDSNNVVCLYDSASGTIIYPATGSLLYNGEELIQAGQILLGEQ